MGNQVTQLLVFTWFPETDAILGSRCGKEVVNLFVDIFCSCQIRIALNLSLDQMVAVDGAGHGDFGKAGADELKHRHLGCSILCNNKRVAFSGPQGLLS